MTEGVLTDKEGRRIKLLEPLGKGGFGVVYLAEVVTPSGLVSRLAVKLANKELMHLPELLARARDEARLMSQLSHDHVVRIHSLTELCGRAAVLMEYVEGIDCRRLLVDARERYGTGLPPRVAAAIIERAASALDAAWTTISPQTGRPLKVVHRDIKPSNILLSRSGVVKVMDFGVARAEFDREAHTESVQFGTWRYMAPERLLENRAGPESDVFSLGATFWELLVGRAMERLPPGKDSFTEVRARLLSQLEDDALRGLVGSMLARDSVDRPGAAEVESVLSELTLPGPDLRRHARQVVPALVAQARVQLAGNEDILDFTNSIHTSELSPAETFELVPPVEQADPGRTPPTRTPLLLGAGLALVVAGAVLWTQWVPGLDLEERGAVESEEASEEPTKGSAAVLGAEEAARKRLESLREQSIARCHAGSTEFPGGPVDWTLRFTILRDGSVSSPLLTGGQAPEFQKCVLKAVETLSFDAPGEEVQIEQSWTLPATRKAQPRPRPEASDKLPLEPEAPELGSMDPVIHITETPIERVTVQLKSLPVDASITVDGQVYGTFARVDLLPGSYTLQAVWSDEANAGRMSCTVDITANTKAIKMVKDSNKCLLEQ